MNPKDMTNKQLLLQAVADIQKARREFMEEDVPCIGVPKDSCAAELLRRLDEVDALRKELKEAKAEINTLGSEATKLAQVLLKARDDYRAKLLSANKLRLKTIEESSVLRKENEELRNALIDARSWMDAGMFEDVPPQYTAMVANVDAVLSKESEASHE